MSMSLVLGLFVGLGNKAEARMLLVYNITFKVVNGSFDDNTRDDKVVTLSRYDDEDLLLILSPSQVPSVGLRPDAGYEAGSWNVTPDTEHRVNNDITYIYTYAQQNSAKVTTAPTGITVNYDGASHELATAGVADANGTMQYVLGSDTVNAPTSGWGAAIPSESAAGTYYVWYKAAAVTAGYSDSVPGCVISKIRGEKSATVTFKVINGAWDDDSKSDVVVVLSGYDGDTLCLGVGQIPAVGNKPDSGYEAGSWDNIPIAGREITGNTTYTYTYSAKEGGGNTTTLVTGNSESKATIISSSSQVLDVAKKAANGSGGESTMEMPAYNIQGSDSVTLTLRTDDINSSTATGAVKTAVDAITASMTSGGVTPGAFFDMTLTYKADNTGGITMARGSITRSAQDLSILKPIPTGIQKSGRSFSIYRYHAGSVSVLGSGTGTAVPFSTDRYSVYAIGYTDGGGSSNPSVHEHRYSWQTVSEATEESDGVMAYVCEICGEKKYIVPLTAYYVFNKNTAEKIKKAKNGEHITITTDRWISFHKMVADALKARPDVSVTVEYLDEGYKGNRCSFTIPAGADVDTLFGKEDFAGFLYLSRIKG